MEIEVTGLLQLQFAAKLHRGAVRVIVSLIQQRR